MIDSKLNKISCAINPKCESKCLGLIEQWQHSGLTQSVSRAQSVRCHVFHY